MLELDLQDGNFSRALNGLVYSLIVDYEIPVQLCRVRCDEWDFVGYDLNLNAKSTITLYIGIEDGISWKSRYNSGVFEAHNDVDDLIWEIVRCMCGRDYIDPKWAAICKEHGVDVGYHATGPRSRDDGSHTDSRG